jgi:ABC-type transport system involved in multi-copper enzyme maturation permease subunit
MMRTLLWKDLKLQRMVLVASVIFYLLPAVVALAMWAAGNLEPDVSKSVVWAFRDIVGNSFTIGVFMLVLTNTALASVAAARERRERSAEFLGAMPVPRGMVVASRFLAMLIGVVGCYVVGFAASWLVVPAKDVNDNTSDAFWAVLAVMTSMVGFAWLVGSLVRSEVIATAGALGITVAVALTSESAIDWMNKQQPMRVPTAGSEKVTLVVLAVGGVLALVVGVVVALRRKTP